MEISGSESLKLLITATIGTAIILGGAYYYYFYGTKKSENKSADGTGKVIHLFENSYAERQKRHVIAFITYVYL